MKRGDLRKECSKLPRSLALLLAVSAPLCGNAAEPVPNAGTILREIQQIAPPLPSTGDTGLSVEQQDTGVMPASEPFLVNALRIVSGNTSFDTPTLHALIADAEGKSLTLPQLGEVVARITDYYHSHGYPLARAVIPAQTIEAGIVRIVITEARYGKITLANSSEVKDSLLQATLAPLQEGQTVTQAEMDRSLLLLSDIPGIVLSATLKPGAQVGTSDLEVEANAGPGIFGALTLDNYGNRPTGRERLGGTVIFNNPLHHGDALTLTALTAGEGLNYGRIAYETLLSGQGTRLGASFMALDYELGDSFKQLKAHGTALVDSLWLKHPILRSAQSNLYGQFQFDSKRLRDRIDISDVHTDRHLELWTASLSGDAYSLGGVNTGSISWTTGRLSFDDAQAQLADAATARTEGRFSRWNATLTRLQSLGAKNELYFGFSAQGSNTNLDSSEKMFAGGPYSVRAYDIGALSGDAGVMGTIELRRDLGTGPFGQWQAVAFVDGARLAFNENPWTSESNRATLKGAGIGLNWTQANQWRAKAYVATRIGSVPPELGSTRSKRAWIEIVRNF